MLWLPAAAMAADIHARLTTGDGVDQASSWPAVETHTARWGPVASGKKVSSVWTLTAQPSVWDPLEGGYRVELTSCVEWAVKSKGDKHCEKLEVLARTEPVTRSWTIKGKGVKHSWSLELWISGETPPSGMPPAALEEEAP